MALEELEKSASRRVSHVAESASAFPRVFFPDRSSKTSENGGDSHSRGRDLPAFGWARRDGSDDLHLGANGRRNLQLEHHNGLAGWNAAGEQQHFGCRYL